MIKSQNKIFSSLLRLFVIGRKLSVKSKQFLAGFLKHNIQIKTTQNHLTTFPFEQAQHKKEKCLTELMLWAREYFTMKT